MAQKLNPFSSRQFLDDDGNPRVGAKLFIYLPGTTTKVTTTQDEAGLVNHTNPIVLNASGEPADVAGASKPIWQEDRVSVDIVLAPSTDSDPPLTPISTWEDISGINDSGAATDDTQWLDGPTPTYVSATSFTLIGDQVTDFHIGRRIRSVNSGGIVYSTIINSVYTSLTTVTIENDSGVLDSGMASVSYALLTATNNSIPGGTRQATTIFNKIVSFTKGADIASASALTLGTDGNYFDVIGTTAITSIGTAGVGTIIKLHFDGALTLTHHATDLVLPDATNITTAAGDEAEFIEYATGDWKLTKYLYSTTPKIQTADLEQTASSEAVTQATIRDSAVGQAQLKTTTASQTVSVTASVSADITPTGGDYTLCAFHGGTSTTNGRSLRQCAHGSTYSAILSMFNTTAGDISWYLYTRYVQASPPYNFGSGDVSLFIMAKIKKTTGEILETYIAPDPPWAYHGPHNLHPIHGKIQKAAGLWGKNIGGIIKGTEAISRDEGLMALQNMKAIYADPERRAAALDIDFTMEEKMRDMNTVPTLFSPCGPDEMYVMIDPIGELADQCFSLHENFGEEGESISNLLLDGYIEIGDVIKTAMPSGVTAVSARWKNTA